MKFKKKVLWAVAAASVLSTTGYSYIYGSESQKQARLRQSQETARSGESQKQARLRQRLESAFRQVPDSLFGSVKVEDLLDDQVYIKLAQDGWTPDEILRIMNTVMHDKKEAKKHTGYANYAKQWRPTYGVMPGGDPLYSFTDTTFDMRAVESIQRSAEADLYDQVWQHLEYVSPRDRLAAGDIDRRAGYFREAMHKPSGGRVHWIVCNQNDPDGNQLYVAPDACGIYRTDNCGQTWTCITDNIPERAGRSMLYSTAHAILVDPDNWNHVFAMMAPNGKIYETTDGGSTWTKVTKDGVDATAKFMKRGWAFRDSQGTLKFIGCEPNGNKGYWASKLWITDDLGVTWTEIVPPDECQDDNPSGAGRGVWFREIRFDHHNRDKIYLCGSRSLLYFDDGARPNADGTYNMKRMRFKVYDYDGTTLRHEGEDTDLFPIAATAPGYLEIDPNTDEGELLKMWFAAGIRSTTQSALYYSEDSGQTWRTLHDVPAGIMGENSYKCIFGNETPWGWLGGFGVNFKDPRYIYGCSMSSAFSEDGGHTIKELPWGWGAKNKHTDGNYYNVSCSRHNADNHSIASHKSGKVFRGGDGGLFMIDRNNYEQNSNLYGWESIAGNLGQMLYYNIRVNEFGDQVIAGNLQDIDVQHWRYGRWGRWQGYEGTEVWVVPYGNVTYFSGGGGSGFDNMDLSNWRTATLWADLHTGSYYMSRTSMGKDNSFFRVDDTGKSVINLSGGVPEGVYYYTLARDKGVTTIYARTYSNTLKRSTDSGQTFETLFPASGNANQFDMILAADPEHGDSIYMAKTHKVVRYRVSSGTFDDLTYDLPDIDCANFIFHEGCGDLYYASAKTGAVYILENGSTHWRFWTKGYNAGKLGTIQINYTTQEMTLSDYGRGVWVADLEHPCDRFFKDGFTLKEISHIAGKRTIGINTDLTIPLYYHYKWWVNDEEVDNPYQYLTRALNPGDRVKLQLTLRESPDVHTMSAEYTVGNLPSQEIVSRPGNYLYSDGQGRVDIGYIDYLFQDFTIEFWLNPASDGTIMANRQLYPDGVSYASWNRGAKGFGLSRVNGKLQLTVSPRNLFLVPNYEIPDGEVQFNKYETGVELPANQWTHIAFSQKDSRMVLHVNGTEVLNAERCHPENTLNNSVYIGLFSDAWENYCMAGAIDELNFWTRALSTDEIRKSMYAGNTNNNDGLVAYYSFNGSNLAEDAELITGYVPRERTRAVVEKRPMLLPIDALHGSVGTTSSAGSLFVADATEAAPAPQSAPAKAEGSEEQETEPAEDTQVKLMKISSAQGSTLGVYSYDSALWMSEESNRSSKYYDIHPVGFMVHPFETADQTFDVRFYSSDEEFNPLKTYRAYYAAFDQEKNYWAQLAELTYDAADKSLRIDGISASALFDRKIIIASNKPAIEVTINGLDEKGDLNIYDASKTVFDVHAALLDNLTEPIGSYELHSSDASVKPMDKFYFTKGQSDINIKVDMSEIPNFGDTKEILLTGDDENMVPIRLTLANKIVPRELGTSVVLNEGSLKVGNSGDFEDLNGTKNFSMAGWVRIDDESMLTGTKPLIYFSNQNPVAATGIYLQDGKLCFNWDNASKRASNFTFTTDDIGRWIHVAAVMTPQRMSIYKNGVCNYYNGTYSGTRILSPLYLGTDTPGGADFKGAFDQVAVWGRSLDAAEVVRFMQERVPLDDPQVALYLNMDYFDGDNNVRELVTGTGSTPSGSVATRQPSVVPFDPHLRTVRSTPAAERAIGLTIPVNSGKTAPEIYASSYEGSLTGSFNEELQSAHRLNKEYYSIVYSEDAYINTSGTATFEYSHPSILEGDVLTLATRRLGTTVPMTAAATATATEAGRATFSVPASSLASASELMLFVQPGENARPVTIDMAFGDGIANNSRYMLNDFITTIPLTLTVTSGADDAVVSLEVDKAYASLDKTAVDMTRVESDFLLAIDQSQLTRNALNPVTVNVQGATAEPLHLDLFIEPRVELRLTNDEAVNNTLRTTTALTTLEVEAELIDGYLDEDVEISTLTELGSSMNIGGGSLLTNREVDYPVLEYTASEKQHKAGLNYIANPYLTDVNLTKHQNISYPEGKVTRFMYQYEADKENFLVYDMRNYQDDHRVTPFQPFFVQATETGASVTVTPVAKQMKVSRRTLDFYSATQDYTLKLELLTDGTVSDRAELRWENRASAAFIPGEDAAKIASVSDRANSISLLPTTESSTSSVAVYSGTEPVAMSVSTVPVTFGTTPISIVTGTSGETALSYTSDYSAGKLWLVNTTKNTEQPLASSGTIQIDPADNYAIEARQDVATDIENVQRHSYGIYVDEQEVTVTELLGNAEIHITDMTGRTVAYERTSETTATFTLNPGVYIVSIRENGKSYSTKILVKQ